MQSAGYVRVIESFDEGWQATLNGQRVSIVPANEAMMAIEIAAPGVHELRLEFSTPGARTGIAVSVGSLLLLLAVSLVHRPRDARIATH